jgi:hypothetical protein
LESGFAGTRVLVGRGKYILEVGEAVAVKVGDKVGAAVAVKVGDNVGVGSNDFGVAVRKPILMVQARPENPTVGVDVGFNLTLTAGISAFFFRD